MHVPAGRGLFIEEMPFISGDDLEWIMGVACPMPAVAHEVKAAARPPSGL